MEQIWSYALTIWNYFFNDVATVAVFIVVIIAGMAFWIGMVSE